MKIILGILGGIAAVVFFIFKGMNSSSDSTAITPASNSGAIDSDSTIPTTSESTTTTTSNTNSTSTATEVYTAPVVAERWKCIPYQQVGTIKANDTEADLINKLGQDNVTREMLGREYGETIPGTIIYEGQPNQLFIEWRDGRAYEVIEKIRIEKENAEWQTAQGIKIGTTLEELKAINGGEFEFFGFEWDYAGKVNSWRNGKISEGITVYLTADNPKAIFPEMLGDTLFTSSFYKAAEAKLRVSTIEVNMRRGIHF